MRGKIPVAESQDVRQADPEQRQNYRQYSARKDELPTAADGQREASHTDTRAPQKQQPVRVEKQVGRNDPCPCGSGKKYKNCHGRLMN